jgi:uncharacterized protein (TIGR03083 family)
VCAVVAKCLQESPWRDKNSKANLDIIALPSRYLPWALQQEATPNTEPIPLELIEWFEQGADQLKAALIQADPELAVWTWNPANQTAAHWWRAQASEAAIHRWDLQEAYACTVPIEPELAVDAIDFAFDTLLPRSRRSAKAATPKGEVFHFHRTDGPGEWIVRFEEAGTVMVERQHTKGDMALRATASDLLLFLHQRLKYSPELAERLQVFGDHAMLQRYFDLVPPT